MPSPLASIYSASDSLKRKLLDMLTNPAASAQQAIANANDRAGLLNALTSEAAMEGVDGGPIMGPKSQQLAGMMADAYNPAGIFIGPTAKLWRPDMAMKAQQMLKKGATPAETWSETLTGRMPGGFRQEIASQAWKLKPEMSQQFGSRGYFTAYPPNVPLNTIYDAPELFAAYPVLKDTSSTIMHGRVVDPRMGGGGYVAPKNLDNPGALMVNESSNKAAKETVVHEMQHAIDAIEGFPGGGSPGMFSPGGPLAEVTKYYKNPFDAYQHLTSEALARLSASRRRLKSKHLPNSYPFKKAEDPFRVLYGHGMDVDPDRLINLDELGLLQYIGGN